MTTTTWEFRARSSILGPVLVQARHRGRGRPWIPAKDLPSHVLRYMNVELRGDRLVYQDFPKLQDLVEGACDVRWVKAHTSEVEAVGLAKIDDPPPGSAPGSKLSVDLKWSCWSKDQETWDERAEDAWKMMELAFLGKAPPVLVHSSPRKEIRFGTVTIEKGKATFEFQSGWDSPGDLVPDELASPKAVYEKAREAIWEHFCGSYGFIGGDGDDPCGAATDGTVKARSFAKLMEKIDKGESDLLALEKEESAHFDEWLKELVQELKPKRKEKSS